MSSRQYFAMTASAMVAPLTVLSAKTTWTTALFGGILAGVYIIIGMGLSGIPMGQVVSRACGDFKGLVFGGYAVATGILTAYGSAMTVRAFPAEGMYPWLPLAVLAVSAWVASKGAAAVARFAGVLCAMILPVLVLVLAFGAMGVEGNHVVDTFYIGDGAGLLALGLLPMAGSWLLTTGGRRLSLWLGAPVVVSVGISLVTGGTLGYLLTQQVAEPFYEMTRGISVFGVMERFEGLVAAVMLLSFGCLLAYLGAIGGRIWMEWMPQVQGSISPLLNSAVALVSLWWIDSLPTWLPGILIGLFWGVLPPILVILSRGKGYDD